MLCDVAEGEFCWLISVTVSPVMTQCTVEIFQGLVVSLSFIRPTDMVHLLELFRCHKTESPPARTSDIRPLADIFITHANGYPLDILDSEDGTTVGELFDVIGVGTLRT